MPQMSPLSWLTLFIIFSITFIFFNILNYFCYFPTMKNNNNQLHFKKTYMNWKW